MVYRWSGRGPGVLRRGFLGRLPVGKGLDGPRGCKLLGRCREGRFQCLVRCPSSRFPGSGRQKLRLSRVLGLGLALAPGPSLALALGRTGKGQRFRSRRGRRRLIRNSRWAHNRC
nr:hypothetical protein Ade03nite_18060 [Actinoplanes derwentensis]